MKKTHPHVAGSNENLASKVTGVSRIPFVFQVTSALREFLLKHSGENAVDFCIGTPPTSAGIRLKQMDILFGDEIENGEDMVSKKKPDLFRGKVFAPSLRELCLMIFRMGSYETPGGRVELKSLSGASHVMDATVISGGVKKALALWDLVKANFGGIEAGMSRHHEATIHVPWILSTPLMERCGLALFIGDPAMVEAVEGLHTSLLGTPSSVQEDLFLMLSNPKLQNFLEKMMESESPWGDGEIAEIFEYMSLMYREPLSHLLEEATVLKRTFAKQFLRCFFDEKAVQLSYLVCGNGGGREALHHIETLLLQEGIEYMILFQPHWTYSNVYTRLGLKSIAVMENGNPDFEILAKILRKLTDDGKKKNVAITINSPNNPSGVLYDEDTLRQLLEISDRYGAFLVDDACYLRIVRQSKKASKSLLDVAAEMIQKKGPRALINIRKKILVALTVSKGLGMAGARLGGVLCTDEKFIQTLEELYAEEFPNMMAFFLAQKLTRDPEVFTELLEEINREIDTRVEKVTAILDSHTIVYQKPAGAFYLEMKVPFLKNQVEDMKKFALDMARQRGIAFMPMEIFGGEKYAIRLSLGGEKLLEQLQEETEVLLENLTNYKN